MSLIKLQKLIESGQTMMYRGKTAIVKSYELKHGTYEILVELDKKPTIFSKSTEENISLWMANLLPITIENEKSVSVDTIQQPSNYVHLDIFTENKKQMTTLSEILLSDIQKVRNDPNYVAQAKQVCNAVNTIVNITKIQILMVKGE